MSVFGLLGDEFEQVVHCHDADTGLRAIVAIHSTVLGPGLGGTRFRPYATEEEALVDVLRLARGMTYKQAVAGLDYGGGKAVIIGEPRTDRTEELILAYARFLDGLSGRYVTAEDVGTTQADMDLIATVTPYVTGTSEDRGGSGDPSPATAWGVRWAMRAAADHAWGNPGLAGRRVVVSGVGKVGRALVGHLVDDGAEVAVADVDQTAVASVTEAHPEVEVVPAERTHAIECEIFSPCAYGAVLSEETIPELRCRMVCGAANNQLATEEDGRRLADTDVLYVPDFVANAGGVINLAAEDGGYDRDRAWKQVEGVEDAVRGVLERAAADGISTAEAADRIAEDRLTAA